jgi:hypothetical protein
MPPLALGSPTRSGRPGAQDDPKFERYFPNAEGHADRRDML